MHFQGAIHSFPKEIRLLIGVFLFILSIGFYAGITFVNDTTSMNAKGIEERYLGNEADEEAEVMLFKKSKGEIKTLVHNHILSLSVIFFLLALILSTTELNQGFKLFLMIEPLVSVLVTFGGIYLMWLGFTWVKYLVMLSGILMTFSYTASVFIILHQLIFLKKIE